MTKEQARTYLTQMATNGSYVDDVQRTAIKAISILENNDPKPLSYEEQKHWFKLGKYFTEQAMEKLKTESDTKAEYTKGFNDGFTKGKDSVVKEQYTILKVNRQPYKCPVCEGSGEIVKYNIVDNCMVQPTKTPCKSCSSTGIVWG